MFSPNVGKQRYLARARLEYADGSQLIVRSRGDPADLTSYSHWFEEKVLDHELKIKEGRNRASDSFGYCNLLSARYARNEAGADLLKVYLYVVRYDLAPPDVNARDWLHAQTGPPPWQVYPDFYVFDVRKRHGDCLLDSYD